MNLIATNFSLPHQTDIYRGEVRDVYTIDSKIVSVATDRLSVFGHLFPKPIPYKGQILNQLTTYFADATKDIVPNWIEYVPDPNVLIGKKCTPFMVNIVIRGALLGHAWRIYEAGARHICGVELPDGLQQYDLFDEPIITPTTKTANGFEEDIAAGDIIELGLMSEADYERLSIIARQLFIRGKQMARNQGLLLADTKYEFGIYDDEIYIIDEIHTPDSSRYFYADEYESYLRDRTVQPPQHISKEFIREWLLNHEFSGLDDQTVPELPEELANEISRKYIELYEQMSGEEFIRPDPSVQIEQRIQENIESYFASHTA